MAYGSVTVPADPAAPKRMKSLMGACPPDLEPAAAPQNHSNRVVYHEPALAVGAALHAAVALRHLAGG